MKSKNGSEDGPLHGTLLACVVRMVPGMAWEVMCEGFLSLRAVPMFVMALS